MKIVYVGGTGRSGTTVLEAVLHELPGVVSVGELRTMWVLPDLWNVACSCGQPARSCALWGRVLGTTSERLGITWEDAARMKRAEGRLRPVARALARHPASSEAGPYQRLITTVYEEVAAATGASVIVDSSKAPTELALLMTMPARPELALVHLVRNPRATAFAWRKHVPDASWPGGELPRFSIGRSMAHWTVANELTARLGRHLDQGGTVRYEDLMAEPRRTLSEVCALVGADPAGLPFVGERTVRLGDRHVLAGNPNRHRRGTVELTLDEGWRDAMSASAQMTARALTFPVARRYGYGGAVHRYERRARSNAEATAVASPSLSATKPTPRRLAR